MMGRIVDVLLERAIAFAPWLLELFLIFTLVDAQHQMLVCALLTIVVSNNMTGVSHQILFEGSAIQEVLECARADPHVERGTRGAFSRWEYWGQCRFPCNMFKVCYCVPKMARRGGAQIGNLLACF